MANTNGRNGFRVVGESQNNTLRENVAFNNNQDGSGVAFDAKDDTFPPGFDNVWVDNDFGTTDGIF